MKVNNMDSKLKLILNKILAAANDEGNTAPNVLPEDYLFNPGAQDTNLTLFLGKWLPRYALDTNFDIPLEDDATIVFPDLDAPTNLSEYLDWLNYHSVCKIRGEGEFLEYLVGYKLYAKLHGLIGSEADYPRNEPPFPMMEGNNSFSTKYLAGTPLSNAKDILELAGRSINELEGLSLARLRIFICKLNFSGRTPEEAKRLKVDLVKHLYNAVWTRIEEVSYSNKYQHPGFYPVKVNGVTIGNKLTGRYYPDTPFTIDQIGSERMWCSAIHYLEWPTVYSIELINQADTFINRRTNELLKKQAYIYFALLANTAPCYNRSENLSAQEKLDCLYCGELVNEPEPKPEIANSPVMDVINTIINTGLPLGGYGLTNTSNRGPRKN